MNKPRLSIQLITLVLVSAVLADATLAAGAGITHRPSVATVSFNGSLFEREALFLPISHVIQPFSSRARVKTSRGATASLRGLEMEADVIEYSPEHPDPFSVIAKWSDKAHAPDIRTQRKLNIDLLMAAYGIDENLAITHSVGHQYIPNGRVEHQAVIWYGARWPNNSTRFAAMRDMPIPDEHQQAIQSIYDSLPLGGFLIYLPVSEADRAHTMSNLSVTRHAGDKISVFKPTHDPGAMVLLKHPKNNFVFSRKLMLIVPAVIAVLFIPQLGSGNVFASLPPAQTVWEILLPFGITVGLVKGLLWLLSVLTKSGVGLLMAINSSHPRSILKEVEKILTRRRTEPKSFVAPNGTMTMPYISDTPLTAEKWDQALKLSLQAWESLMTAPIDEDRPRLVFESLVYIGSAWHAKGDWQKAIEALEEAQAMGQLRTFPLKLRTMLWANLAQSYLSSEKMEEAKRLVTWVHPVLQHLMPPRAVRPQGPGVSMPDSEWRTLTKVNLYSNDHVALAAQVSWAEERMRTVSARLGLDFADKEDPQVPKQERLRKMAHDFYEKGEFDRARRAIRVALYYGKKVELPFEARALTWKTEAKILEALGNTPEAITVLKKLDKIAKGGLDKRVPIGEGLRLIRDEAKEIEKPIRMSVKLAGALREAKDYAAHELVRIENTRRQAEATRQVEARAAKAREEAAKQIAMVASIQNLIHSQQFDAARKEVVSLKEKAVVTSLQARIAEAETAHASQQRAQSMQAIERFLENKQFEDARKEAARLRDTSESAHWATQINEAEAVVVAKREQELEAQRGAEREIEWNRVMGMLRDQPTLLHWLKENKVIIENERSAPKLAGFQTPAEIIEKVLIPALPAWIRPQDSAHTAKKLAGAPESLKAFLEQIDRDIRALAKDRALAAESMKRIGKPLSPKIPTTIAPPVPRAESVAAKASPIADEEFNRQKTERAQETAIMTFKKALERGELDRMELQLPSIGNSPAAEILRVQYHRFKRRQELTAVLPTSVIIPIGQDGDDFIEWFLPRLFNAMTPEKAKSYFTAHKALRDVIEKPILLSMFAKMPDSDRRGFSKFFIQPPGQLEPRHRPLSLLKNISTAIWGLEDSVIARSQIEALQVAFNSPNVSDQDLPGRVRNILQGSTRRDRRASRFKSRGNYRFHRGAPVKGLEDVTKDPLQTRPGEGMERQALSRKLVVEHVAHVIRDIPSHPGKRESVFRARALRFMNEAPDFLLKSIGFDASLISRMLSGRPFQNYASMIVSLRKESARMSWKLERREFERRLRYLWHMGRLEPNLSMEMIIKTQPSRSNPLGFRVTPAFSIRTLMAVARQLGNTTLIVSEAIRVPVKTLNHYIGGFRSAPAEMYFKLRTFIHQNSNGDRPSIRETSLSRAA